MIFDIFYFSPWVQISAVAWSSEGEVYDVQQLVETEREREREREREKERKRGRDKQTDRDRNMKIGKKEKDTFEEKHELKECSHL